LALKKFVIALGKPTVTREIGLLGADTRFKGLVRFRGTLRVDGLVDGNIQAEPGSGSVLIINQEARVTGDISADQVLISGAVLGEVRATERVEIYRSGDLKGDIYTKDIMIEAGAAFAGYCHMEGTKAKEKGEKRNEDSAHPKEARVGVAATS